MLKKQDCYCKVNKCMVPLKMICRRAAIRYNWGRMYDPFFAYTKLGEEDHTVHVNPFDIKEQKLIISVSRNIGSHISNLHSVQDYDKVSKWH